MKKIIALVMVMTTLTAIGLPHQVAEASLTPAPTANFISPGDYSNTATNFIDVSLSISANGHPGLVGKTLTVLPVICDSSLFYSSYTDCEPDLASITTVTLNDLYNSTNITFQNLALYYLGTNHVTCYVYDSSTENGDFCGGSYYPDMRAIQYSGSLLPVYRFWSKQKQSHFYTMSHDEKWDVERYNTEYVWKYEKVAFFASRAEVCDGFPVYRFWSKQKQSHFYTMSQTERDLIINKYPDDVWKYEKIAYCAEKSTTDTPVYRFWSTTKQSHFYTISKSERDKIIRENPEKVWRYEGVAFYAYQ